MTMRTRLYTLIGALALALFAACSSNAAGNENPGQKGELFMDMHDLGPGKVTAAAVAKAHAADLKVQGAHDVQFLRYWVDEENGKVYCLARAKDAHDIIDAHREAHGLLPNVVGPVIAGE
jgi:hypothetical protein